MNIFTTNVLEMINPLLSEDIVAYHQLAHKEETSKDDKKMIQTMRYKFARYLVSVATHSMGLGSSLPPYNCSREQMIAYVMGMFKLDKSKVRKMIGDPTGPTYAQSNDKDATGLVVPVKRHHWRPELRIRLGTPMFFFKDSSYYEKLRVRVYLFKVSEQIKPKDPNAQKSPKGPDQKLGQIFHKLLHKLRSSPDFQVRPITEMINAIQFEPKPGQDNESYRAVQNIDGSKIVGDLYLPIRRYYCDNDNLHAVRFEFWSKRNQTNIQCSPMMLGNLSCSWRDPNQEDFIGYIDINLSDIPSYAARQTYPILSSRGKKVTNCEIIIEPKNRRIAPNLGRASIPEKTSKVEAMQLNFIINHLRLNANCILYQSFLLAEEVPKLNRSELESEDQMTLDNLLYLPAYTLINQHRLQSNLNFYDDQSLRRASMLLLLLQFERSDLKCDFRSNILIVKSIILAILKNEYLTSYNRVDSKTMQETNAFKDRLVNDPVTTMVTELEAATFREFISQVLTNRLKDWFARPIAAATSKEVFAKRSTTLMCLRLCRLAFVHLCITSRRVISNQLLNELMIQKGMIDQLLCEIAIVYIRKFIDTIIKNSKGSNKPRESRSKIEVEYTWSDLLRSVRVMNDDIRTHWTRIGLRGLMKNHSVFLQNSKMLDLLYQKEVTSLITAKVESYLL